MRFGPPVASVTKYMVYMVARIALSHSSLSTLCGGLGVSQPRGCRVIGIYIVGCSAAQYCNTYRPFVRSGGQLLDIVALAMVQAMMHLSLIL